MRVLITSLLLLVSCSPIAQPAPPQQVPTTPVPVEMSAPVQTVSPMPWVPPTAQLDNPAVTLATSPFPITPSFALARAAVSPGDEETARWGVEWYLQGLDRYRDQGDYLPVRGAFGEAVAEALVASRTPGVKRTFVLESLRIEGLYRKPWGTQALADVRVTIVDRAVDRSAPDQREAGLLRLSGDRRLQVIDAWNDSTGRWFNGRVPDDPAGLREAIAPALGHYLRTESWVVGLPTETYFNGVDSTPFQKARGAYLATLDRAATRSRTFEDVTGVIERFDTFAEMVGGLATVRLAATVATTDTAGQTQRQPVTRHVKVFFGNWIPEVVDEEVSPGVWRSGGDLALFEIDVNRA